MVNFQIIHICIITYCCVLHFCIFFTESGNKILNIIHVLAICLDFLLWPVPPFDFIQGLDYFWRKTVTNDLGWVASYNSIGGNILGNYRAAANNGPIADFDTLDNGDIKANPYIMANNQLLPVS